MTSIDVSFLIIRVAFGLSLVAHGLNKVRGTNGLAGTAAWFASIGMRWPSLQARVAATTEIVAGIMFAAGLLTSVSAAAIVALMVVAIVTVHWRVGYFIFLPNGGWEYCAAIAATASAVSVGGAGSMSLDHLLGASIAGWHGVLAIALGGAVAGVHLSVSFRPATSREPLS